MKKFFCYGKKDFCENTDLCIECPHFAGAGGEYREAPMTNADRIRAMSDEELASLIMGIPDYPCDEKIPAGECDEKCEKCILEWLQQPAEDSTNG